MPQHNQQPQNEAITENEALSALGLPPYLAFRFSAETLEARYAHAQLLEQVSKQLEHKNAIPTVPALRDLILPLCVMQHDYAERAIQDVLHHAFNLTSYAISEAGERVETLHGIEQDDANAILPGLHASIDFLSAIKTYAQGVLSSAGADTPHREWFEQLVAASRTHLTTLNDVVDTVTDLIVEEDEEGEDENEEDDADDESEDEDVEPHAARGDEDYEEVL